MKNLLQYPATVNNSHILNSILAFLSLPDLPTLMHVTKKFASFLKSSNFYKFALIDFTSKFLKTKISHSTYKQEIFSLTGINLNSEYEILKKFSKTENLILNPCGNFLFEDWKVVDGGDGWEIESYNCYQKYMSCFVASFQWCHLEYDVILDFDFREKGNVLIVGSPVSRRSDCPAKAKVSVKVIDLDKKERVRESLISVSHDNSDPNIKEFPWQLLSVCIPLTRADFKAVIRFSGVDENFWKGHYGPRFGYCYARILNSN